LPLPYQWQYRIDRWKNAFGGLFGGGNQQPRPKICPACGTLVGINATRCHQCGTNLRFSLAAMSKGLSGVFGGRAPMTTGLLIVNVLMFAISWMATAAAGGGGGLKILWGMGGVPLYRLGESFPYSIFYQHQFFRLVTAQFLHGGLIHIGFNMMVLMDIGPVVEEVYGSARFLFLYLAAGIVGFLFSAFSGHNSIGASAPILGLIGMLIAVTTKRSGAHMQELRSRLISWVVSIFVLGFFISGIDNWAHAGGLAAGFGLGKLFADREPMNASEVRGLTSSDGWPLRL
jgi:rhomboid protease GluP